MVLMSSCSLEPRPVHRQQNKQMGSTYAFTQLEGHDAEVSLYTQGAS